LAADRYVGQGLRLGEALTVAVGQLAGTGGEADRAALVGADVLDDTAGPPGKADAEE
jgi:hypothetical protein